MCEATSKPVVDAKLSNPEISELSGVVASRLQPGVFFAHNDSGDKPRIFAIKLDGTTVGEYQVSGASAVDWEDITAGPCPAGQCVFVGDIGDNNKVREQVVIYRISEAALAAASGGAIPADAFPAVYPDGAHNAETLLADPSSGDLFIVTKEQSGPSLVFRFPASALPGEKTVMEQVASLTIPSGITLTTGGDAHPCAPRFLLRTYTHVFEYRAPDGGGFLDSFKATPVALPGPSELQGEAIAYLPSGVGWVSIPEGNQPAISVAQCP